MIVVSDAGPLHYLAAIGQARLLQELYGEVTVPSGVAAELRHWKAPKAVRDFMSDLPAWVQVASPSRLIAPEQGLDAGEREAISLALELKANLFLCDDLKARAAAGRLGIAMIGTLGVLELAAARGLARLVESMEKARVAGLWLNPDLIRDALERDRLRKEKDKSS